MPEDPEIAYLRAVLERLVAAGYLPPPDVRDDDYTFLATPDA